jgi:hypothetical protein
MVYAYKFKKQDEIIKRKYPKPSPNPELTYGTKGIVFCEVTNKNSSNEKPAQYKKYFNTKTSYLEWSG